MMIFFKPRTAVDIVDRIRDSSGMETTIEYPFNLHYGIAGEYIEVLVSNKRL